MSKKAKPASAQEQAEMWARWNAGDRTIGAYFIKKYDGVLGKYAQRGIRMCPHLEREDFIQVGSIGIITALDRFDPSNGGILLRGLMSRFAAPSSSLHKRTAAPSPPFQHRVLRSVCSCTGRRL